MRRRAARAAAPIDGREGNVIFDDANTYNCSRCQADTGVIGRNTVTVEIEIYPEPPDGVDGGNHNTNAPIYISRGHPQQFGERQYLEMNWRELEPLAVALSRAVSNAKARGFLPTGSNGAAT